MTMMVPAVLCAAAAAWSLFLPGRSVLRLRALMEPSTRAGEGSAVGRVTDLGRRVTVLVGSWSAGRRLESQWRAAVITLCDGVGAELTAGRAQETALSEAIAALEPEMAAALRAAWTGEVPEMLERVACRPGAEGLRLLAACWRVGAERGGAFVSVVEGLAAALRDEEAHREEVAAQLAGPRATARLLAGLPVLGVAMGGALGAHPLSFLFGTLPGLVCLILGVGLDALGLWWTRRLVAAAEAPR